MCLQNIHIVEPHEKRLSAERDCKRQDNLSFSKKKRRRRLQHRRVRVGAHAEVN